MQRAIAAYQRGDWAEAECLCRELLAANPDHFDALHLSGIIAARTGRAHEANDLLSRAVSINASSATAHNNRGNALRALGHLRMALESYGRALALQPDFAEALYNRGTVLHDLERHSEALDSYEQAIARKPGYAIAYCSRGNTLLELGRHTEALESAARALALNPDYAEAHNVRGNALSGLHRHAEALDSYRRALALRADYVEAYNNSSVALGALQRHAEALECCERALALAPASADPHNNRGNALRALGRYPEALESYERALALKPRYAEAHCNRGNLLFELKRYAEALEGYERALRLKPDYEFLYGIWVHAKLAICDWDGIAAAFGRVAERLERREKVTSPFALLAMPGSLAMQRLAAEVWVQDKCPASHALPGIPGRARRDRIRIGYFSADFREHPVSHLIAELFERHDRSRFGLYAFSFGPDANDAMRARVAAAFDRFIDVRGRSDADVAMLARELEIDIAVDLTGFTQHSRTNIFALRAAPVQVNYLGYPGTMGAEYFDYLVADTTLIPDAHARHYAEKIAYLPDSFQVNDTRRPIADRAPSREEMGLPATGFVFCCFNRHYKIVPGTFDVWMRILGRAPGSVLWLSEDNEWSERNLRKEAALRGVAADRLIFARRVRSTAEHLARYRLADLFLDTLPYNAHATASDALWAGLPILTRLGETYAGRVAASLLNGIRLPELVAETSDEYESLAITLATDPDRLLAIKWRLSANRLAAPLFDIELFTRHLEACFAEMYDRQHAGLAPEHIHVHG